MVSISFTDYIIDLYDRTGTPVIKFLVQIWALPLPTCLTLNISHDLNFFSLKYFLGFPGGPVVEKTALQCRVGLVGSLSGQGTKTPRGPEWLSPDAACALELLAAGPEPACRHWRVRVPCWEIPSNARGSRVPCWEIPSDARGSKQCAPAQARHS